MIMGFSFRKFISIEINLGFSMHIFHLNDAFSNVTNISKLMYCGCAVPFIYVTSIDEAITASAENTLFMR